jgi:hypothetical protein
MHLHAKSVTEELARLGHKAELVKGAGYFFFHGGETEDWIDRSVAVRTINSMTLKQWVAEFRRLKELNEQMIKRAKPGKGS